MSTTEPARNPLSSILLPVALVGLGTSILMLILYLMPEAGSCGPGGGCDTVRTSQYSELFRIPLPYFGIAYFAGLGAALLVDRLRRRPVLIALGIAGIATGLTLLTLQGWVLDAWCPYCVVIDTCALAAGLAVLPAAAEARPQPGLVLVAAGLGTVVPVTLFATLYSPPPEPVIGAPAPEIAALSVDGETTIVEFVDFECPFCRRQHARLSKILEDYGEAVTVQTRHFPLRMHPHAKEAARYACCADEQGRGEAMADALFTHDDLSAEGCLECATRIGLDTAKLQDCLQSDRPDARLEDDSARAKEARVRRLPTCFIGDRRFEGLQSEATLRAAIDEALKASDTPS